MDILLDPMERVCNEALVRAEKENLVMEALYDGCSVHKLMTRSVASGERGIDRIPTDNNQQQPTLSQAERSENQSINKTQLSTV